MSERVAGEARAVIPEPHTLALFAVAAFLLAVVPGPAVVYIVTQSIDGGRVAGLVSARGIATGGLVHVMFAAVGLSALLLRSAVAFEVVKYAGAAYLIVMGIRRLMEKDVERRPGGEPRALAAGGSTARASS